MNNKPSCILIPIYNEVDTVHSVVNEVVEYKNKNDILILVQDGSNDGTGEIISSWENTEFAATNNIIIINHDTNMGYGYSLLSGFNRAIQMKIETYLLTMDCDLQHQPCDIPRFFTEPHTDILSGSRYLKDETSGITTPKDRQQINHKICKKLSELSEEILNVTWVMSDAFCGMKRYSIPFLSDFLNFFYGLNETNRDTGYGFPLILWKFYLLWVKYNKKNLASSFHELSIPRIYITDSRSFGEDLDFPIKRYRYYLNCLKVDPGYFFMDNAP